MKNLFGHSSVVEAEMQDAGGVGGGGADTGVVGISADMADEIFGRFEGAAAGEGKEAPVVGADDGGKAQQPVVEEQQPTAEAEKPATAEVEKPASVDAEMIALRAQVEQLQQMLVQQGQQQQQPAKQAAEAPALPNYAVQIPPQILKLLDSEDPTERAQGLSNLVEGTSVMVHRNMRQEMATVVQELLKVMPGLAQHQAGSMVTAQTVQQDFYGAHPDLNNELLRPMVMQVAQKLMGDRKWAGQGWSGELRDTIAQTVREQLKGVVQVPQAKVPVQPVAGSGRVVNRMATPTKSNDMAAFFDGLLN